MLITNEKISKEDSGKPHKIPQFLKPYIVAWTNHSKHKLHKIIGDSTIESNSKQPKELWNSNKIVQPCIEGIYPTPGSTVYHIIKHEANIKMNINILRSQVVRRGLQRVGVS